MGTNLGPGSGSQWVVNVYNADTAEIAKGELCELVITAVAAADGLTDDKIIQVVKNTTTDSDAGAGAIVIGVAKEAIPVGKYGQVVRFGLAQCLMDDTAAVGVVVGVDASAPERTSDAASATFQAPHGIQLETGVQGELKWVFVDFVSSRFGGNSTADGITDTFWGQSY